MIDGRLMNEIFYVAPKAEAPKDEAPKAEAPKAEAPKAEAPKAEAPKAEKTEAPKAKAKAAAAAAAPKKATEPVVQEEDEIDEEVAADLFGKEHLNVVFMGHVGKEF